MAELQVATLTGGYAAIKEAVVNDFKTSLHGALLHPGDDDYDEARKIWERL